MKDPILLTEGDVNLSAERTQWNEELDTKTKQSLEEDASCFLHQSLSTPCLDMLESCEGIWLTDISGRNYMDFHGNNVHQIGHRNPFVIERIKQQLDTLPFSPRRFSNQPAIDAAQRLTGLLPEGLDRVLFAPGGTSAVSMALKLARIVTGKQKVVSYIDSFHGASLDAITAGGEEQFRKYMGPLHPDTIHIPGPESYRDTNIDYADLLEQAIISDRNIGVFIAETIRNTDVQIPEKEYWQKIRAICTRHKVLLILDEIPIAFGRTGTMFAFEHYGIEPDIICLGKGLGAGIIPFAAMIAREEYNIAGDVSLGHFTHEKNPLGSAAALGMLDFIRDRKILEKVKEDEIWIRDQLASLKQKHPIIGDIRGIGMLWGIELVLDPVTKEKATAKADQVLYDCLRNGLSFKVSQGNVLQLSPPLTITRDQWSHAIDIIDKSLGNAK